MYLGGGGGGGYLNIRFSLGILSCRLLEKRRERGAEKRSREFKNSMLGGSLTLLI